MPAKPAGMGKWYCRACRVYLQAQERFDIARLLSKRAWETQWIQAHVDSQRLLMMHGLRVVSVMEIDALEYTTCWLASWCDAGLVGEEG
ncbi:MAG: hypothetical protein JXR76_14670 [Deltaproteobacteria bacterium]|nr:hypothetical protein [Deltaproteobacteria bacterium]